MNKGQIECHIAKSPTCTFLSKHSRFRRKDCSLAWAMAKLSSKVAHIVFLNGIEAVLVFIIFI
jgi:hypothetical protein